MAMLAERREKKKYSINPRGLDWSNDENKFGQKLMEKMGWTKGKGLGLKEHGKVDLVKVSMKMDKRGMGCSIKTANNWIAHQDDFSEILENLGKVHATEDDLNKNETSFKKIIRKDKDVSGLKNSKLESPLLDLENKSKKSINRVDYQKFTRSKNLSTKNQTDLDCIFGIRPSDLNDNVQTQTVEPPNSSPIYMETGGETGRMGEMGRNEMGNIGEMARNENKTGKMGEIKRNSIYCKPPELTFGVKTITQSTSIVDYFAQKMASLKVNKKIKSSSSAIMGGVGELEKGNYEIKMGRFAGEVDRATEINGDGGTGTADRATEINGLRGTGREDRTTEINGVGGTGTANRATEINGLGGTRREDKATEINGVGGTRTTDRTTEMNGVGGTGTTDKTTEMNGFVGRVKKVKKNKLKQMDQNSVEESLSVTISNESEIMMVNDSFKCPTTDFKSLEKKKKKRKLEKDNINKNDEQSSNLNRLIPGNIYSSSLIKHDNIKGTSDSFNSIEQEQPLKRKKKNKNDSIPGDISTNNNTMGSSDSINPYELRHTILSIEQEAPLKRKKKTKNDPIPVDISSNNNTMVSSLSINPHELGHTILSIEQVEPVKRKKKIKKESLIPEDINRKDAKVPSDSSNSYELGHTILSIEQEQPLKKKKKIKKESIITEDINRNDAKVPYD